MKEQGVWSYYFFPIFVGIMYLFLYIPFIILILFSFNNNEYGFEWKGFTTKWYAQLWQQSEILNAVYNSFVVASCAVILSLSMSALFIFFGNKYYIQRMRMLFYMNLAVPEIVLAVGLMSFFYFFGISLGITTLIASHAVLGLGYVVPLVYDRYHELDKKYVEASLDLGATPWQTFRLIVLPLLLSSLFAAALLVFIISFDDFVLSFFCSGGTTQTLPMYIFALIRSGSSPVVSALSTILLMVSSCIVSLFLILRVKRAGIMR